MEEHRARKMRYWTQTFFKALMSGIWIAKCVYIFYCSQSDAVMLTILRTLDQICDAIVLAFFLYYSEPLLVAMLYIIIFGLLIKLILMLLPFFLYRDNLGGLVSLVMFFVSFGVIYVMLKLLPDPPPANAPQEDGDA